jgi:hypothetical protein
MLEKPGDYEIAKVEFQKSIPGKISVTYYDRIQVALVE